jgi:uncharacterized membrane protein YkgB
VSQPQLVLRLAGVVGVLATTIMVIADLVMLYAPPRGGTPPLQHFAVAVSRHRLVLGDYLGLFALPFVLVGLLHVYIALRPAGFWFAVTPVALLGYSYVLGAAFHHGVALLVSAAQQDTTTAARLGAQFLRPLLMVFTVSAMLGAILLFLVLLMRRTAYPAWMAWLSPVVTVALSTLLQRLDPSRFAGVLVPAGHNLAMLVFLTCSTIVLWR